MALPFVDPAGIAGVAAAALLGDGHTGRTYVLTGPEPISPRRRAAALGELVMGRLRDQTMLTALPEGQITARRAGDALAGLLTRLHALPHGRRPGPATASWTCTPTTSC